MKITKKYLRALIKEEVKGKINEADRDAKLDSLFDDILGKAAGLMSKMSTEMNTPDRRVDYFKGFLRNVMKVDLDPKSGDKQMLSAVTQMEKAIRSKSDKVETSDLKGGSAPAAEKPAAAGQTGDALDAISATKGKG